jgi:flagellar biosynthesis/type III secretory pathway protein FliH
MEKDKIKQLIKEAIEEDRNKRWDKFTSVIDIIMYSLILIVIIICIIYIPYSIGKGNGFNKGYTKGYDTLNNEIYYGYNNLSCGNYLILKNYNESIKLFKENCIKYDGSMFIDNPDFINRIQSDIKELGEKE